MAGVEQSVLYMKVTEALREPTPGKLAELSKTYNIADFPLLLLLAVQLGTLETVQWVMHLYEEKGRNFNETDPKSGDTALHKAVKVGRVKVTRELMLNPNIDDTVRNKSGITAPELASSPEMESVVSSTENKFAEQMAVRLKTAFKNHDLVQLAKIYENPRVSVTLNINGIDPSTGRTVLHDSAQSNDLKLVQFILAHGGDPLVRDKIHGKLPEELTTSDEIRRVLNNSAKSKAILDQTDDQNASNANKSAPSMEGYLKKWTNITSGYKLRWFVLRNGELSYFKRPEDAKGGEHLMRGSISLRHAIVRLDSSEKNKFEIRTPSTRFHLKASHPAETNKWVWALQNAITFVRDEEKRKAQAHKRQRSAAQRPPQAQSQQQKPSEESEQAPKRTSLSESTHSGSGTSVATGAAAGDESSKAHKVLTNTSLASQASYVSHRRGVSSAGSMEGDGWLVNDLNAKGDDDDSDEDYEDDAALMGPQITAESLIGRLSAIKDLMTMLVTQVQDETMRDAITTAQGSIDVLSSDIVMFQRQALAHIQKVKNELEDSDKAQRSWASNYRDLEVQYENLEGQLHALRAGTSKGTDDDDDDEFFDTVETATVENKDDAATRAVTQDEKPEEPAVETNAPEKFDSKTAADENLAGSSGNVVAAGSLGSEPTAAKAQNAEEGTVPADQSDSASLTTVQKEIVHRMEEEKSFAGYEDPPRKRLALDADNRPKLSLWGILKNLIGKDMTKMTLPVTFNECTSLLQRSAEDMEYVDLLDRAAEAVDDGGLRMAYVAAFAGSSYSSTVNRIAKPFNPLLGETYEYARPDKGYRLFAEQVSHHPPVGALIAESRHWDFYGESNVESKFYGRSFDINPLGLWYINLRPDKGADVKSELYSFRKITSSVVGIMLGNPVVDNYGDMHITNHTTGITALISYKARGWRGSSAYKLQGTIKDKNGTELWTIGGQWNDKIWAKKTGSEDKKLLWQVHPRHKVPFNLTDFAVTLNALPDSLKPWLPPTDTRLRPDQRAMEEGRYDDASDEKFRVEEKQRRKRREREAKGIHYEPQWFRLEKHPVTGLDYYKPINNYWEARSEKQLADKGDIF